MSAKRFRSPAETASSAHLSPAARAVEAETVELEADKAKLEAEKVKLEADKAELEAEKVKLEREKDQLQADLAPMTAARKFNTCPDKIDAELFSFYRAMQPSALQEDIREQKKRIDKKETCIEEQKKWIDEQKKRIDKKDDDIRNLQVRMGDSRRSWIPAIKTPVFLSWIFGLEKDPRFQVKDPSPCAPHKLQVTWKRDAVKAALIAASERLDRTEGNKHLARILGLRLGSGFGKTHVMLDAPEHLGCTVDVYITYNADQDLKHDVEDPGKAILLRILLRLAKVSNVDCPKVFEQYTDLLRMQEDDLVNAICEAATTRFAEKKSRSNNMFIGIDEVGVLMREGQDAKVRGCTSAVSKLVVALQNRRIVATVLVSALTSETFAAVSSRPVMPVELPVPDMDSHDCIRRQLLPNATRDQIAQVQSFCGLHFRSIVNACLILQESGIVEVTLPHIVRGIRDRLRLLMSDADRGAVRKFVCRVCEQGLSSASADYGEAMKFVGAGGAVPPVIVHISFTDDGFQEFHHPASKIFEVTYRVNETKQLENCGYEYDRFRAYYKLPVVPHEMQVQMNDRSRFETPGWFAALRFERASTKAVHRGAILESTGKDKCRVVYEPYAGEYCFPSVLDHPWIDRAVVVCHGNTNEKCLVLYRDKINDDLPAAVKELNAAARTFDEYFTTRKKEMRILCVAGVIDASVATTAQGGFQYPFLLVRNPEVEKFYTATFAPAVLFCRYRHRPASAAVPPVQ